MVGNVTVAGVLSDMIPQLRPYQIEAKQKIRQGFVERIRSMLLVAPARSGKTTIFCDITNSAINHEFTNPPPPGALRGVLIIAARQKLIHQASDRLKSFGIKHGVIMGNDARSRPHLPVQVASIQTLRNRPKWMNRFKLIIIDEAHACASDSYLWLVANNPKAYILGFTATPFRADGKPLGKIFGRLIKIASVTQLVEMGFLVPYRAYGALPLDTSSANKKRKEYTDEEQEEILNKPQLVGDVVSHWLRIASDRKTIVYAATVKHSKNLINEFRKHGIICEHIDANTTPAERKRIEQGAEFGNIQVVCNVGLWTEGVDIPSVSCIVAAFLTKSKVKYIQACSRGMGAYSEDSKHAQLFGMKEDMILIDHGGLTLEFGSLYDQDIDELSTDEPVKKKKKDPEDSMQIVQCPNCYCIHKPAPNCIECGHLYESKQRKTEIREGELIELDLKQIAILKKQEVKKAKTYDELLRIEKERGYKTGWAERQLSFKKEARENYLKKHLYERFGDTI